MADVAEPSNEDGVRFGTILNITTDERTGIAWWSHTIQLGPTNYTYGMPLIENEQFWENLAAHARSLLKEHRRKKMGIELPDDGTTVRHKSGIHLPRRRGR